MKKLVIATCAAFMVLVLAACGGSSSSGGATTSGPSAASGSGEASAASAEAGPPAAAGNMADYGWISFELPDGWQDSKESDSYETIADSANNRHIMKFSKLSFSKSYPTAYDMYEKDIASDSKHYAEGGTVTWGNYFWYVANFEFNGNPSICAYADINDEKCLCVTVYEMTLDDPEVKQVLDTIQVDESQLG